MEAIIVLALVIIAWILYGNWLKKGISMRAFKSRLSPDQLRQLFEDKVCRSGWKIVDDGNPMVAQSSLVTGVRQQIGLRITEEEGLSTVLVGPERWISSWGVPKKGHTIRIRLNSFVESVRERDGSINVSLIAND